MLRPRSLTGVTSVGRPPCHVQNAGGAIIFTPFTTDLDLFIHTARLKLKCSRVFPCRCQLYKEGMHGHMSRRRVRFFGIISINLTRHCVGSLTTGKGAIFFETTGYLSKETSILGNRFVLANTEELHEKINELSYRVRQLEDGLKQSHLQHTSDTHPLLLPDLLNIKRPLERERPDTVSKEEILDSTNDGVDAMGSLSISDGGRATFFGQAANSWYLLKVRFELFLSVSSFIRQNETSSVDEEEPLAGSPISPHDLSWMAHSFPFSVSGPKMDNALRENLLNLLPRADVAQRFCSSYYRHAAWIYCPITETDFYQTVFTPIYESDGFSYDTFNWHKLGVLFMVLALGTLVDLEMPAHSHEATEFYQLARAALALDSVLDQPSFAAIQALLLMCHFMFWADIEQPRWVIMGLVVKLAHSVRVLACDHCYDVLTQLARLDSIWKKRTEDGVCSTRSTPTTLGRQVFLPVLILRCLEIQQSLTFGRPPSFSLAHIDAKLPHGTTTDPSGETEMSFEAWKHRWSTECLSVLHDQVFGARPPAYSTIKELDKKLRAYYIPPSLQVPGFGGSKRTAQLEQPTVQLTMQRYCAFAIKEIATFYMHRGFFAQAFEGNPSDPMGSKYAPSVLAAYSSACTFVGLIESLFKQQPILAERMWFYFMHVFSCAIVLGSIAVKPRMAVAPSALSHLETACSLFENVSDQTRTTKILPILHKLKARAREALANPTSESPRIKTEAAELSVLGGGTRLVTRRTNSTPSTPSRSDPASSPSPQPTLESPWQGFQGFPPVSQEYSHPQYMLSSSGYESSIPMQSGTEYYSYSQTAYSPGSEDALMQSDLSYSWQNFMSQYQG
ncbi:unnamed protein product [Mycena citricolor]|uniref:Transcription factor domain-containing protein n=1 Tax=Mycena citricolor TaxID=2018698 RepID=A0AAD2K2G0_9AGAR|nr:unnamed protein product [Mycena citricolor]